MAHPYYSSLKRNSNGVHKKTQTQTGYINVSSPELTAIDLIENEKSVGGLNRVCTVLNELVDVVNLDSLNDSFFKASSTPVFQRLGYIMEHSVSERIWRKLYIPKWRPQD